MCYAETFWLNGQAQAHGIKNSLNYSNEFPSNEDVQIQSDEYLYLAAYQRYIVLQCCSAAVLQCCCCQQTVNGGQWARSAGEHTTPAIGKLGIDR